ncbi:hypothetical protein ACFV5G_02755 [Streptomyces sp. NPDC059766]|uniref:hypothetical protein n=1 Tax=Streptomyces sp. NPDC059766 TaxID=3346940 RepID=UPI00365ACBAA
MSIEETQQAVAVEIRAAIRAATPRAVYPDDEFGSPDPVSLRVAGWDPDETQSNDRLLKQATSHLLRHGWKVFPEPTDSDDRSARIIKPSLANGRLYAANQGLTFTGSVES